MPIERIKLTPNSMVIKSASGNVVFDTVNNKYIKTAAGGNLLVNKQVATPFYYTSNSVVAAPIINGAIMKSIVVSQSLAGGAQLSFRYPEWTGGFTMATDDRIVPVGRAAGLTSSDTYGIKVYINGAYIGYIFVGGIDITTNTCNPGDLITVGGVDRFDSTYTNLLETNTSSFNTTLTTSTRVHFFAYQNSGTSLPLTVTA
jgi:hypothetical protein